MSNRLTSEELLAKMNAHIRERKAVYDALSDNPKPECGLFALYIPGHCVLPKGHEPAADHKTQYGEHFTRGLREDEGGHE